MTEPHNHERAELLRRLLQPGDVVTHTRCLGIIEEHVFAGWEGQWQCGYATADTKRVNRSPGYATDISPRCVTHINRDPVELIAEMGRAGDHHRPYALRACR